MKLLKKQGVAWVITIVMILIAIGIGSAKAPPDYTDSPIPAPTATVPPVSSDAYFVYDDAGVLNSSEEAKLSKLNRELADRYGSVVACVTTNYGYNDLYNFALDYAEHIGLGGYDFIVVLDISGENYWLVQGAELVYDFTDEDCGDYAWNYMENDFARGDYGDALINLVDALADWYRYYY